MLCDGTLSDPERRTAMATSSPACASCSVWPLDSTPSPFDQPEPVELATNGGSHAWAAQGKWTRRHCCPGCRGAQTSPAVATPSATITLVAGTLRRRQWSRPPSQPPWGGRPTRGAAYPVLLAQTSSPAVATPGAVSGVGAQVDFGAGTGAGPRFPSASGSNREKRNSVA